MNLVTSMSSLALAHTLQVLHGQHADIHEAIHAVRQTRLLALVQLSVLEGAGHALLEARLCQVVGFCPRKAYWLAQGNKNNNRNTCGRSGWRGWEGRSHTGLDPGALLLVLDELAQVLLVLVGEPVEVGLVDRGGIHGFVGGWCSRLRLVTFCWSRRGGAVFEARGLVRMSDAQNLYSRLCAI